jgi:SPP1 gp7 family putative phage head morphogenesis protein
MAERKRTTRREARREVKEARQVWERAPRAADAAYERALKSLARRLRQIIDEHADAIATVEARKLLAEVERQPDLTRPTAAELATTTTLQETLKRFAESPELHQWANRQVGRMLGSLSAGNLKAWMEHSKAISEGLRAEIRGADIGPLLNKLREENVHLITTLPETAARQVQEIVTEAQISGVRSESLVGQIRELGDITEVEAIRIARTETARASSMLVQVRAESVGSTHYMWKTSRDSDVRKEHRALNGKVFAWTDPPVASRPEYGIRAHPGCFPNCRCYPSPILPDVE